MKRAYFSVWVFAGLACVGLKAQTAMTANIPFNFQVGNNAMPAGEYRIDYSPGMLRLQCSEAKKSMAVLTVPKERKQASENGVLQFNHYGDTYFFAGVWAPNSTSGGAVLPTAREEELARRLGPIQPVGVALKTGR